MPPRPCFVPFFLVGSLSLASVAMTDTPLPRAEPEEHQVDGAALEAALGSAGGLGFVRGMVVARDGVVIGEDHYGSTGGSFRQSRSVTKSVTSILIGIAIERGLILEGVEARLVDYLPPELVPADPAKQQVLISHLLNMTSGFQWDEDAEVADWLYGPDPVRDILSRPLAAQPGTRWNYNTAASHLLSVVISQASGMSTQDFADLHLFGPLGITDRFWMVTGGYHNGGHGLFLLTEALAKIGAMTMDNGRWNGDQIVPAWWINRSVLPDISGLGSIGGLTERGYGWLWWLGRAAGYRTYSAIGWGGQFIFCVPALDVVVAVHTISDVNGPIARQQEAAVLGVIVDEILPAVTDRRVFTATGLEVAELDEVDEMMRELMQEYDIRHTTAALTKNGRLVYARGFTWDEASVDPIEPIALFRIGSIGKAIASLAAHRLMDDGLLTHETLVQPILELAALPGETIDSRFDEVTVDHLLTHTGGMYSEDNIYEVSRMVAAATGEPLPASQNEILSYIMSHPFIFDSGTSWDYNNYGYMMLDRLVDRLSGRHFVDFVNEEFFRPAGVGRARIAHQLASESAPTEVDYDGHEGDPYTAPLEAAVAAGGWVMAAPDLARLWSVIFDTQDAGGLLDPVTRESMFESPFPISNQIGYWRGWYGEELINEMNLSLGWLSDPDDEFILRGHSGGGSGIANFAFWHSDDIVMVIFSNKDPIIEGLPFPEIATWPDHDLWSSVGVSATPVGAAETESWLPVVAHADGVGSSVWRSDLGLLNRSTLANQIRLRLLTDEGSFDHDLELAPGAFTDLTDVMDLFDLTGSAPIRVFSSEPLTISSRTYNLGDEGTFGQYIGGVTSVGGLKEGEEAVLMQLREDEFFRTNIGLFNAWRRRARVAIDLHDADGTIIASANRLIPPLSTIQLARPYEVVGGRSDVVSGYAVIRVIEGQQVSAYASVVDNITNDPTTIPMKTGVGSPRCFVAAAAHADGAHGSLWRTDTTLLNLSGATTTAELRFRGSGAATSTVVLAGGEQLRIEDVLGELGTEGNGSLEIIADGPLMVGSRTYNLGDEGTFGQYLDGVPSEELSGTGDVLWLPHLRQSTGFRSNLGLLNTSPGQVTLRIRLLDADGIVIAETVEALAPHQRRQLQEPFDRLAGRNDLDEAYARVTVEAGDGVIVYASVIDNHTNDPTTVPMVR